MQHVSHHIANTMLPAVNSVRVLIGCEYSQVIMSAFLEAGFDAYSCDILPCEGDYPERHIQGDLLEIMHTGTVRAEFSKDWKHYNFLPGFGKAM